MTPASGSIRIIEDHWPIVIHRSEGRPTGEQVDAYVREATAILLRGERHAVVMDTTGLEDVTAYAKLTKKDWLRRYGRELRAHCACTALVLPNPLQRFVFATLMLIVPFPTPYRAFDTVDAAMAWAREMLETKRSSGGSEALRDVP